jgi:hypothetical protein
MKVANILYRLSRRIERLANRLDPDFQAWLESHYIDDLSSGGKDA